MAIMYMFELSDCGDFGYGNTYQVEIDAYLNGFATKSLSSVSAEECVKLCTVHTDFLCRETKQKENAYGISSTKLVMLMHNQI